ncbi:unnamed protein product [Closterium sp. NIES-53]
MYLMTCTRPDLAYPLGLLARYVAPGRHRKVHMDAAKRVLRYLCSTSGMGLVLGGRGDVVLTGHSDASWRSTRSSSVLSFSCEAKIYATAMAAQELRWLTYLLSDLGERPRSPPVLYVNNKAAIALCQEHRLEHRTKHIALRYFLARELQQRGQLRLAHVATRAKTADIFTKALPPGDHQQSLEIVLGTMAHSLPTLAVALLIASFSSHALAGFMGGASTFGPAGTKLVAAWNKAKPGVSQDVVNYDAVGSGTGISGFNSGTYVIAVSDDPMTTSQESGNASPKITVPLCVSTFSFFVNGKPNIWMTATQTYQIYSGAITAWSGVPGAAGKVAGAITRVARNDKSGSTAIVKTMWSKAVSGYGDGTDGTPMTYTGLKKADGTQGVCDAIAGIKGAIGYAFTGGCTITGKRQFAAVKNAAGVAVVPSKWKPGNAIPTTPPAAPDASWANVDFVFKAGLSTPPMVSMEFAFIRKTVSGAQGRIAKAFMQYMIGVFRKNGAYGFAGTPPAWLNPSITMVNAIVVT